MEFKQVSKNGFNASRIIAGVMRWGQWGHNLDTKGYEKLIHEYLNIGISTFDHADIYGNYTTEAEFGKAIVNRSDLRNQMQLVSKVGIQMVCEQRPQNKVGFYELSEDYITRQVEQSLKNLCTDRLDLLLIHRPSIFMNPNEIASTFEKLKTSGKVLHFGVSNFTPSQFDALNQLFPLVTNQVEASLMHLDPFFDGTFDQALKHKFSPMVWSPFKGEQYFNPQFESETKNRIKNLLLGLGQKYKVSEDLLQLAFLLKHPAGLLPIVGTANTNRIKNLTKLDGLELSLQDAFQLLIAAQGHPVP